MTFARFSVCLLLPMAVSPVKRKSDRCRHILEIIGSAGLIVGLVGVFTVMMISRELKGALVGDPGSLFLLTGLTAMRIYGKIAFIAALIGLIISIICFVVLIVEEVKHRMRIANKGG